MQQPTVHHDNVSRKLVEMLAQGAFPSVGLTGIVIAHDAWCSHFTGGPCDCAPEVRIVWTQPDVGQQ
jgi:hypothetical protein